MKMQLLSMSVVLMLMSQIGFAGLVGSWDMDDSANSGGTAVGDPVFDAVDKPNAEGTKTALLVDSNDGFATTATGVDGAGARTVAAWIKVSPDAAIPDGGAIVSWGSNWSQTNSGYLGGRFTFKINSAVDGLLRVEIGGGFVEGTSAVNDGQWHHVAMTLAEGQTDTANVKFYIDGEADPVSSFGNANPIDSQAANIVIGYCDSLLATWSKPMSLEGGIDEVVVYDEELSAAAIAEMARTYVENPAPDVGADYVNVSPTLTWAQGSSVSGVSYDVYLGSDPNELSGNYYGLTPVKTGTTDLFYDPPTDLDNDTTYYWRVDAIEPNDPTPIVHTGPEWFFTTEPANAIIITDPEALTVAAGATAEFSVTALNAETYQWYKDDAALSDNGSISGATTSTLTISGVQESDEGYYRCEVDNVLNNPATSEIAQLITERLVAHWTFDDTLADATGEWPGTMDEPNYAAGIDGNALELYRDDGKWVNIPGSETFFNFHPRGLTVSLWYQPDDYTGLDGYMAMICKNSNPGWNVYDTAIFAGQGLAANLDGSISVDGPLDDGNWHLATVTYDGDTVTLYLDGLAQASASGRTPSLTQEPVAIGALPTSTWDHKWQYRGRLDDVRVYSYALSPYEVADLYLSFSEEESLCLDADNPGLRFDLDGNCQVDLADFAEFAADWLNCYLYPECQP